MKLFEPFAHEIEIYSSGKNIQFKSIMSIPLCWIKISDPAGKIVFKKIEKDLTETIIPLNVKDGFYDVTIITKKCFATKMVFLE